jgi:3-hydroxyacyl-[acyl-carrier-protein] dehydratase
MENPNPILDGRTVLEIQDIMAILPHRYPFLLIDRLMEIECKKRIVAIKNVTINEPYFAGHFPNFPIMPGVLIVESIAQAGGALLLTEIPDRDSKLMVFTGIERAKFRRPVVPGDQLRIEIDVLNWKPRAVRMQGRCTVEGKLACEAIVMCQLVPRQKEAPPEAAPTAASVDEPALEPVTRE